MNIDEISRRRLLGIAGTGIDRGDPGRLRQGRRHAQRDGTRDDRAGRLGAGYDGVRVGARDHDRWH